MKNNINKEIKICVVGLGYVGLPLAVALAENYEVIGFDIDKKKIEELKKGYDRNGELESKTLIKKKLLYSNNQALLKKCNFFIITVPTPVTIAQEPDLTAVISACKIIGQNLNKGSIVVLESTVYPGVTEEVCVPILERESGLTYLKDFKVGYSPERINPGDKVHTIDKVIKVVSGCDKESLDIIAKIYGQIAKAGIFRAKSIKVAEAAKVIENTQRDINIALMNELKIIFDRMGIDINDVLEVAKTKWNFISFYPGLVGGHCIGVDPYYLAYKARVLGIDPQMILAGRRINDGMAKYHADKIIKTLIDRKFRVKGAKILILGATFKPDVKDTRNSKVQDIIKELKNYGCKVDICDPMLEEKKEIFECKHIIKSKIDRKKYDLIVKAVNHSNLKNIKADYLI